MLHLMLMHSALSVLKALFGGVGVFFLISSFSAPDLSAYALIFLGTATAIQFSAPK